MMVGIVTFSFWFFIVTCIYVYFGYIIHLWLLSKIAPKLITKSENNHPFVTIITSAYNEEDCIKDTITNKNELDYPREKIEYIIVSDCSSDRTEEIINQCISSNDITLDLKLFIQETRQGKTKALNRAIKEAKGEIIVFSDANSIYDFDAIKKLVANFSDESIGYVTGKMVYLSKLQNGVGDGSSTYMKYENLLRSLETKVGSIVGVDGGIDAFRKKLYVPMEASYLPDFVLPLNVIKQGYRVVYEPKAVLKEEALSESGSEFQMRVRVSLRAFWTLWDMKDIFNFFRYGFYSWQVFTHKLLRYFVGLFQIVLVVLNMFLFLIHPIYTFLFFLQVIFYFMAYRGYLLSKVDKDSGVFYVPFYFCLINFSALIGFLKFIQGEKMVTWVPRLGSQNTKEEADG